MYLNGIISAMHQAIPRSSKDVVVEAEKEREKFSQFARQNTRCGFNRIRDAVDFGAKGIKAGLIQSRIISRDTRKG